MHAPSTLLACGLALAMLLSSTPAPARDATLAHMFAKGSLPDRAAEDFAERVEGIRPVVVVADAALGDERANLHQLAAGEIAFAITGDVLVARALPRLALANFPFLHETGDAARAAYSGWLGAEIRRALKDYDVELLSAYCVGQRYLTAMVPVRGLEDVAGLTLRLPPDPVVTLAWRRLGAEVVNIPFPELPGALAAGRVQAQENPLNFIRSEGLHRHQRYLVETGHYHQHQFILASTTFLTMLDATARAVVHAAAEATAAKICGDALAEEEATLAWLTEEAGMTLLPFERAAAREAALTATGDLEPAPSRALKQAFGLDG